MGFPRLDIHLDAVRKNAEALRALCGGHGIDITGVTKVFAAHPRLAQAYLDAGIERLGDSRVENLKRLGGLNAEKWLIRIPMLSEASDVVQCADVSLNSEWRVIAALDEAAGKAGKTHGIILMSDLGDLREGYVDGDELLRVAEKTSKLQHVRLRGVGVNMSCFSFIHPDIEKMNQLANLAARLPMDKPPVVSGGNSATLHLMMQNGVPSGVNNIRLGESLLFGRERCCYNYLEGTRRDAFLLRAEIVELKEKPSLSWGEAGVDSYGNAPKRQADRGIRKKAVLALGKLDCDIDTMRPVDGNIEVLGASSDHLMIDVTDSREALRVGDEVAFELGYFALMRAFASQYVEKQFFDQGSPCPV